MNQFASVLTELQGLRGENLLTKALALLIMEELAGNNAQWVAPLFTMEKVKSALQKVNTEQVLNSGAGESLGRVDMLLQTVDGVIAVEVKLDAAFQTLQLERYARSKADMLCVLAPKERLSGVPNELPDADGLKRPIYKLDWETMKQRLADLPSQDSTAGRGHALLRRAFLLEEIQRYYDDYYRLFDVGDLEGLQQSLDGSEASVEAAKASRLLDSIRRLPALRGFSPRLASATHYLGFDLSLDDKGLGPLGWIGFVDTQMYKLSCGSEELRGWRLVLCRAIDYPGAPSAPPEAGLCLRHATLTQSSSVQGITRHAKTDMVIYDVPELLRRAGEGKPEDLWNQRIQSVFGDIARAQPS